MDKIKLAQRTIAMLSSMIESGESHTTRSREMKDNALNGLEQLTIPVVSDMLCGSFDADITTSSATKCKCGREKWEHPKAT